jgi:hypothetical protein
MMRLHSRGLLERRNARQLEEKREGIHDKCMADSPVHQTFYQRNIFQQSNKFGYGKCLKQGIRVNIFRAAHQRSGKWETITNAGSNISSKKKKKDMFADSTQKKMKDEWYWYFLSSTALARKQCFLSHCQIGQRLSRPHPLYSKVFRRSLVK